MTDAPSPTTPTWEQHVTLTQRRKQWLLQAMIKEGERSIQLYLQKDRDPREVWISRVTNNAYLDIWNALGHVLPSYSPSQFRWHLWSMVSNYQADTMHERYEDVDAIYHSIKFSQMVTAYIDAFTLFCKETCDA